METLNEFIAKTSLMSMMVGNVHLTKMALGITQQQKAKDFREMPAGQEREEAIEKYNRITKGMWEELKQVHTIEVLGSDECPYLIVL